MKIIDAATARKKLKEGYIVIVPTETVYGLAASLFNEEAVAKVFQAKGRPSDNPLIVHVGKVEDVAQIAVINADFEKLANAFWPGPLTMILPALPHVPLVATGGLSSVAVRMPNHPLALAMLEEPFVAPSANISGRPSPTVLSDAIEDLEGRVEFAVDGGPCSVGIESTVVSLLEDEPKILRPGSISGEEITRVLGKSVGTSTKAIAPGMKYRHYAPKARVVLVESDGHFTATKSNFYSQLREADRQGLEEVRVQCNRADTALMDRVLKAASK